MVPSEPRTNHSTQCLKKMKRKRKKIHPQMQHGPPAVEFKKLINLIYKQKFSLVFNLFKFVWYNLLDSEKCSSSINNLSNTVSMSILVTNYNQHHGLKPKYSDELILSPRLKKEAKFRNRKSRIKGYKKLFKNISGFKTESS